MKALSTRLFALNEAWKENANIYRQMAKQMNMTDMAMWALYTLRVEPGEMTQRRMCEFLHEPKQTINSALKKMEADGLITLQSGSNRRTKTIHLTAAGEAHIVLEDGTRRNAACIGGMLSMMNGVCRVLATTWEWEEDIDAERAEAAKHRAEQALANGGLTDKEYRIAEAKLQRALVRLSVKE